MDNAQLREMAQEALENWLFDADTDPGGDIRAGLEYYASDGDAVPDEDVDSLFEGYSPRMDKWDILAELAKAIGSQR